MCAWGTSNPITATPTRLQGIAFSIAKAISLANMLIPEISSEVKSKYLSTSLFGTIRTCPFARGEISKNAKNSSFSLIL